MFRKRGTSPRRPGRLRHPSQASSISSSSTVMIGLMSTVFGTASGSGYRVLFFTPKITTRRFTPICGAASPTPSMACMVSRMSSSKARNSSPKLWIGSAHLKRRASPIRSSGLIAIAAHRAFEDAAHPLHRRAGGGVDLLHVDALPVIAAPRRIIHDHGDGGVMQLQLHRQRGLRHAGHADHVGTVALISVDPCGAKGADVIAFVQRRYALSFRDALEHLADAWGITS